MSDSMLSGTVCAHRTGRAYSVFCELQPYWQVTDPGGLVTVVCDMHIASLCYFDGRPNIVKAIS